MRLATICVKTNTMLGTILYHVGNVRDERENKGSSVNVKGSEILIGCEYEIE